MLHQTHDHVGVTPFVVVPGDQLDEVVVEHDAGSLVEDARVRVADEILRDDLVARVGEDAFEGTFARGVDGVANLGIGGGLFEARGQVDDGDVRRCLLYTSPSPRD